MSLSTTSVKGMTALEEFKSRIADVVKPDHDDWYLRKWLIARSFDVNKAEQMYRNSMTFRGKMKVDTIAEEYEMPPVLKKYMIGGLCGYDKEGFPVRVEPIGCIDMKGLMCSCKRTDLEKCKLFLCELVVKECREQTKKLGKRVDAYTSILDMEGVSTKLLWRPGLNMYLHLVRMMEDNYPEFLKRLFVINAPKIFPLLWKICRPLVSNDAKNKIHVLGPDYKSTLLKYLDPEQLPAYLGGTQTDSDGNPRCIKKIGQGGIVPYEYYLSQNDVTEGMCEVTVQKSDQLRLEFEIDKPGSILRWEFRTCDYDIGFCVTYQKSKSQKGTKEKVVVEYKKFNSHQLTEDDSIVCDDAGTYTVIFDNTYSWLKAKTLWYLVEIHTTSDDVITSEADSLSTGGSWTRLYKDVHVTHF